MDRIYFRWYFHSIYRHNLKDIRCLFCIAHFHRLNTQFFHFRYILSRNYDKHHNQRNLHKNDLRDRKKHKIPHELTYDLIYIMYKLHQYRRLDSQNLYMQYIFLGLLYHFYNNQYHKRLNIHYYLYLKHVFPFIYY